MEQKTLPARKPVKTVPRLSARERRCSQSGKLTAALDGAIRLDSALLGLDRLDANPAIDTLRSVLAPARDAAKSAVEKGRVEVVETYFDPEGRPIKRKGLGAARVARAYDAQGNQVEEAYFNAGGKPTAPKDVGAARIAWRYDDSGNRVEAAFFAADGSPIRRRSAGRKGAFEAI